MNDPIPNDLPPGYAELLLAASKFTKLCERNGPAGVTKYLSAHDWMLLCRAVARCNGVTYEQYKAERDAMWAKMSVQLASIADATPSQVLEP